MAMTNTARKIVPRLTQSHGRRLRTESVRDPRAEALSTPAIRYMSPRGFLLGNVAGEVVREAQFLARGMGISEQEADSRASDAVRSAADAIGPEAVEEIAKALEENSS